VFGERKTVKPVKKFGMLAAAIVCAMALLGPSTAMGESTALCEADQSPCGSPVSHIHYVATNLEILTSTMDYNCDALFLASVSELGAPQVLEGQFTYANCNHSCSREEVNGPTVLDLLKTGHESAEVTEDKENGSGIHSMCSLINCVYSFEGLVGSTKGPLLSINSNGEISWNGQTLVHTSGTICPTEAHLDATFVPLSATYISS
jgi:hypothetical protein